MKRTTVNIDEEALAEVADEFGTQGHPSDTINQALQQVIAERRRREAAELFQGLDYDFSPENLQGAWA